MFPSAPSKDCDKITTPTVDDASINPKCPFDEVTAAIKLLAAVVALEPVLKTTYEPDKYPFENAAPLTCALYVTVLLPLSELSWIVASFVAFALNVNVAEPSGSKVEPVKLFIAVIAVLPDRPGDICVMVTLPLV